MLATTIVEPPPDRSGLARVCFIAMVEVTIEEGVSWADAAIAFAAIVGTVAAFVTAYFAYHQLGALKEQVRQAQKAAKEAVDQAERARRSSIRPVVIVPRTTVLPGPDAAHRFLEVRLRNVGLGTALNVEVQGWVVSVPREVMTNRSTKFQPFLDQTLPIIDFSSPTGSLSVQAIAANSEEAPCLMVGSSIAIPLVTNDALVLLRLRFRDLDSDGPPILYPDDGTALWKLAMFEDRPPRLP